MESAILIGSFALFDIKTCLLWQSFYVKLPLAFRSEAVPVYNVGVGRGQLGLERGTPIWPYKAALFIVSVRRTFQNRN